MPGGIDDMMNRVRSGEYAKLVQQREESFEDRIVKRVLRYANLDPAQYVREERQHAERGLTFEWFNIAFSAFPVYLGTQKIPHTRELLLTQVFGPHFMRLPFVKAYQVLCDSLGRSPHQDRIGLVFTLAGLGEAVLHNYPLELHLTPDPALRAERDSRVVRVFGNPPVVYVLDPLAEFLDSIGTDWALT